MRCGSAPWVGHRRNLGLDDGCSVAGTKRTRFIGPWAGRSSVAGSSQTVTCADGHRLVSDLADADGSLVVDLPNGHPLVELPGPRPGGGVVPAAGFGHGS